MCVVAAVWKFWLATMSVYTKLKTTLQTLLFKTQNILYGTKVPAAMY